MGIGDEYILDKDIEKELLKILKIDLKFKIM